MFNVGDRVAMTNPKFSETEPFCYGTVLKPDGLELKVQGIRTTKIKITKVNPKYAKATYFEVGVIHNVNTRMLALDGPPKSKEDLLCIKIKTLWERQSYVTG